MRFVLPLLVITIIGVVVGVEPLFLADPPGRLALFIGIGVFGFLLIRFPEVFFGLWVAGVYNVFLSFFPVTNTVRGWGLVPLAGMLLYVMARKRYVLHLGLLTMTQVAFLTALCIGTTYSTDSGYGQAKVWQFVYMNLVVFIGPIAFADDSHRVKNIVVSFAIGTVLFALSGLYFFHSGNTEYLYRLTAFSAHPIGYGQVCGLASTVLLCTVFTSRDSRRWILLPILLAAVYLTILSGTRGALIAFVAAGAVLVFLRLPRHPASAVVTACLGAAAVLLAFHYAPADYTERFQTTRDTLLQEDRLLLWRSGFRMFLESPLVGCGTGAFNEYMEGLARYPHNIFIEVGAELGLVGLTIFAAFICITLRSAARVLRNPVGDESARQLMLLLLVCFTFYLVAAQFSLDITGNSNIWLISGLIWSVFVGVRKRDVERRMAYADAAEPAWETVRT